MRYLAIHFDGYAGSGIASPAFEIEADSPISPVKAVYAYPGASSSSLKGALGELRIDPEVTAGEMAWRTGGSHVGYLALKEGDMIVYSARGPVAEDDQDPWQSLNPDSYWTGKPEDDDPPADAPTPEGISSPSQVMESHVID